MSYSGSEGNWKQLRSPDAGTRPTPLSRPTWPWSVYSHRHTASGSSPSITAIATGGTATPSNSFNADVSILSSSSADKQAMPINQTTRQWNFTAFEWTVHDVRALCDAIEHPPTGVARGNEHEHCDDNRFEVLREHPSVGDGKFILEVARTPSDPKVPNTTVEASSANADKSADVSRTPTLSLYITSLMDHTNMDFELSASLLVAIKCVDERGSDRGSPAEWAWEFWEQNWCFRKESEYWECQLPPLSTLLQNPRIAANDSFIICFQIHSPVGPFVPQLPSAHYIPRDLLDGFEASLDNAQTGDVVFVTLERSASLAPSVPQSPLSSSTHSRISAHQLQTARKRVIYAHSDILKRRSAYFNTMLTSSFSESSSLSRERKLHTVVVEDADFVSVYWLLKWAYTNWVLFRDEDDPRVVFDTATGGLSVKHLAGGMNEWDWRTMIRTDPSESAGSRDDTESDVKAPRSVTSVESPNAGRGMTRAVVEPSLDGKSPSSVAGPSVMPIPLGITDSAPDVFARLHSGSTHRLPQTSTTLPRNSPTKPSSIPVLSPSGSVPPTNYQRRGPPSRTSKSPMQPRGVHYNLSTDPHPHPAGQPPPASALAIYKIAHRYLLPGLASLALDHMMSTLTPRSAFPLLLATHFWDDLHGFVEDYIVEHWDLVSSHDEFELYCEEVAAGEWGPHGGKTLAGLFRRLRSPGSVRHAG